MSAPSERAAAAQAMLGIPLFNEIMDDLEAAEINGAVALSRSDHEAAERHLAALRSIRNLRLRITALANEGQPSGGRKAPA